MVPGNVQDQDSSSVVIAKILAGNQQTVSYAGTSQYQDFGGSTSVSACGLAALNGARVIFRVYREFFVSSNASPGDAGRLLDGVLSQQTAEEIVSICSLWPSDKHLEVDELLELPIFKHPFDNVKVHYALTDYTNFLNVLKDMRHTKDIPVAVVFTRSPEIIVCVKLPTRDNGDIFVIFDSHPRPAHPDGAGFIINTSEDAAARYLSGLLAIDPHILADPSMRWQAQLFGQFSSHTFTPKSTPLSAAGLEDILMESSALMIKLKADLDSSKHREEELVSENGRLTTLVNQLKLRSKATDRKHEGPRKVRHDYRGPPSHHASTSKSPSLPSGSIPDQNDNKGDRGATESECATQDLIDQLQMQYLKEDKMLAAERSALLARETPTFQCQICLDEMLIDHIAQMSECKHSFCRDCIRNHVLSVIGERRYPVLCPMCMTDKKCEPTMIDDGVFLTIGLTTESMELIRTLQNAPYSIVLHCRKCKNTMLVDRKDHQESSTIICPLQGCGYVWCKNCELKIVIGGPQHSCDGSSELKHLMKKQGWKACPGCKTPIQKEAGCNHMNCMSPGCNVHFCYRCGDLIVRSVVRREIESATSAHYRKCLLFEVPRR